MVRFIAASVFYYPRVEGAAPRAHARRGTRAMRRLGHSCRVLDVWIEAPTAEHEEKARETSLTSSYLGAGREL